MDNFHTLSHELFDILKEDSRISKEALNKIIVGIAPEISPTQKQVITYTCDNCPYKHLSKELLKEQCNEFCSFKEINQVHRDIKFDIKKRTIINSETGKEIALEMPFVVYNEGLLAPSKTAIKLFLLYHFFAKNKYYIAKNLPLRLVSKLLNVSITTVKRNNELLQRLNFIHATEVDTNTYDICITDIDKLHKTEKEGGKGYITLPKKKLQQLLGMNNINNLRVTIKELLKADMDTNKYNKKISGMKISIIKEALPFYLRRGRKGIEEILKSENSMFKVTNIDFEKNICEVDISNYEKKDVLRSNLEKSLFDSLDNFIRENNICLLSDKEIELDTQENRYSTLNMIEELENATEEDKYKNRVNNLVQLSIEYGAKTIRNMLLYVQRRYITGEGISIKNIGGFIRSLIIQFIENNGSYLDIAV